MGITGLLPFVKKASRNTHIKHFSGQTAAVDAYGWLYKGAFACAEKLGKGEPTNVYVTFCMKYVNVLISHGVKPVLVFDGRNLPAKAITDEKRRKSRKENEEKAKEALRQGKPAWEYFTRCINVTPKMARDLIQVLREQKIDYIIAPYEADAQLAYLARKRIVDFVVTEDSDLILFGCPKIFFKMSINGDGVVFDQSRIHLTVDQSAEKFQFDKFRQMCILSGCDYLPSLPGVGLGRAKKVFQMSINPDVTHTLKQIPIILKLDMTVSAEYIEQFVQADNTFKYQLVFDPMTRSVLPLTPYPPDITADQLHCAGKYEKKTLALDYALGNVDIHTKERVGKFDPQDSKSGYTKSSMWVKGFEIRQRVNQTAELKSKTKHTSTNGLKLSVNVSSILKKRPIGARRQSSQENETVTDTLPILEDSLVDQDLLSMYANGNDKTDEQDSNFNKRQNQEDEDNVILSRSSQRNKRICLSNPSIYSSLAQENEIGSDAETEPIDSTEDDTTCSESLSTPESNNARMSLRARLNPFLKSPQTPAKIKITKSPNSISKGIRISSVISPTALKPKASPKTPQPICLVKKNTVFNPQPHVIVKSKYFRNSSPGTIVLNGIR